MLPRHKIPPPLIALACGLLMWWLAPTTSLIKLNPSLQFSLISLLLCAGVVFDVSALYAFRKANTTINPMTPDRTSSLVSHGIYRVSRNPMYVGLGFFLLAWGLFLQSLLSIGILIVFIIAITALQIKPEELALEKHFGDRYTQYKKQVRRWL